MLAAVLIFAYLLGAVPFAVLVARVVGGVDLRRTGSGNTGAMNTIRSVGKVPGIVAGLLDAGKGALAMLVAYLLIGKEAATLAGAAAIIGHCYSIWLVLAARNETVGGWKHWLRRLGGKGLATGMAVLCIWHWPSFLTVMVAFFSIFGVQMLLPLAQVKRKDETWPTILGLLLCAPVLWLWTGKLLLVFVGFLLTAAIVIKHLPDLREGFFVEPVGK